MMDVHSPEQRSFNMSRIKGKDTRPEIMVRRWLWAKGYRYRLHPKHVHGKPDLVFFSSKKAVFINGCFWHMHNCKYFNWPATNSDFWKEKILNNVDRDQMNYQDLNADGWKYSIIWECELKLNFQKTMNTLIDFLKEKQKSSI